MLSRKIVNTFVKFRMRTFSGHYFHNFHRIPWPRVLSFIIRCGDIFVHEHSSHWCWGGFGWYHFQNVSDQGHVSIRSWAVPGVHVLVSWWSPHWHESTLLCVNPTEISNKIWANKVVWFNELLWSLKLTAFYNFIKILNLKVVLIALMRFLMR